jgi:hypothetical protein
MECQFLTEVRFGTWNIRSVYRAGFLTKVSKSTVKIKVRRSELAGEYTFLFYGKME